MLALMSPVLQPEWAEAAAHTVTQGLLQAAKADMSCLQELQTQAVLSQGCWRGFKTQNYTGCLKTKPTPRLFKF